MAIRYFVCGQCGSVVEKIVDSGNPLICCGREMKERIPGMSEGAGEKHVPVYTVEGNRVHVEVGEIWHPMQEDHFIRFIALEGTKKNQTVHLNPGDNPVADFVLSEEESVQAVYAYCNLHSIWKKRRKKWKTKNMSAPCAAMSTIRKSAIRTTASRRERRLKICRRIGYALCAD